jgi:hypothetical protein
VDLTIRYDVCPSWLSVCEPPGDELREQMSLRVFPFFFSFFLQPEEKRKEKKIPTWKFTTWKMLMVMWFEVACIGKRPNWLQLLTAKLFSFFFFSSFLWHRIALTISLSLTYSLKHTRRGKIQLKSSSTLLVCVCVDHCGREESCCSHANLLEPGLQIIVGSEGSLSSSFSYTCTTYYVCMNV